MDAYNFIIPTIEKNSETYKNRHQISIDKYATFKWRGVDAYETFGCLITNRKDLKWVNYAAYTDEFSNPMFSSSVSYLGTTYKQKSLKLNLGVYWITEADYRLFLNWISPDVIGEFGFGYNEKWAYKVKVNSVSETTYYPIGYNEKGENVYYAELVVTFITVDNTAVTCIESWHEKSNKQQNEIDIFFVDEIDRRTELYTNINYTHVMSLLPNTYYEVSLCQIKDSNRLWSLSDLQGISDSALQNQLLLFSFTTNNFAEQTIDITMQYDSERGNLYINNQLLSDLVLINGKSIIKSYQVNKFVLPGILNNASLAHNISVDGEQARLGTLQYYDMYGDLVDTVQIQLNDDLSYSYLSTLYGEMQTGYIAPPAQQKWICDLTTKLSNIKVLNTTVKEYAIPVEEIASPTKLYVTLETTSLTLNFYAFDGQSSINIDWGDESEVQTYPSALLEGPFECSHTYSALGDYVITITKTGNIALGNGSAPISTISNFNNFISSDCITKLFVGKGFKILENALTNLTVLTKVVLTDQQEIVSNCFKGDTALQFVNFLYPVGNRIIRKTALQNTIIQELNLLPTTSLDSSALGGSQVSTMLQCDFINGENLIVEDDFSNELEAGDFLLPFYIRVVVKQNTTSIISSISDTPVVSIYPKRQL